MSVPRKTGNSRGFPGTSFAARGQVHGMLVLIKMTFSIKARRNVVGLVSLSRMRQPDHPSIP